MNLFIIYSIWFGIWTLSANGQPSDRRADEWYKEEWPAQPYAFGYDIRDTSGNEQYRKEMSDGDRVTGSYGYLGPDGLYRHVEYVADINGFRAKIRTSEPGTANDNPSNVQIESNPILVLSPPPPVAPIVPITPSYGDPTTNPNINGGYRRDGLRPPPNRPQPYPNPNRSSLPNPGPRPPEQPRVPSLPNNLTPINRDRFGSDGPPVKPNFEDPNLRPSPIDNTRGGQPVNDPNRVTFGDLPDNVIPFRGVNHKRPTVDDSPRDVPQFNNPRPVPQSPDNPRGEDRSRPPYRRPPYGGRGSPSPQPNGPPSRPYDESGQRDPVGDRRGSQRPEDRRYEVTTKGGSTKLPPHDMGFIEATKGPVSPYRPINRFPDPSLSFDDDSDYQFKRRQDEDRNAIPVNKPVFEDRVPPKKIGGFVRTQYNDSRSDRRDGRVDQTPTPVVRTTYNSSSTNKTYDSNQDRREGYDKRVRRPTKVFVTSGPISGIPHTSLPPIKSDDRSFGDIDDQQRQHFNNEFDARDGQQIGLGGVKGRPDRDRPLPPTKVDKPRPVVKPYYGGRRDRDRDLTPNRPQSLATSPRLPGPPYDPRDRAIDQNMQTLEEDPPIQTDDEFPQEYPPDRQSRPQDYQPMPNGRPDRQPLPRRPDRPYKPRTQPQDRPYVEQQFEVQPYQTQNSASITSPINTIASVYKPVDGFEDSDKPDNRGHEKPSLNTPLSPSSYKVTPFPVNETKVEIKPIIVSKAGVYTDPPELSQMEIPRFGTRLRTPEPVTQGVYKPIDQFIDNKPVDQQNEYDDQTDENPDQNAYDYSDQNDDQNQSPINNSNDNQNVKTDDNPISNPNDNTNDNLNPNSFDSIDNDQYYSYYDESENIENRESTESSPQS